MPYPLTWPDGLRPTSESWIVENADRSGGLSLVGTEQVISSGSSRVRAKFTFQLFRDNTLRMRALIAGLRGRAGTVLVGPFDMTDTPQPGVDDAWALDLGLVSDGVSVPVNLSAGVPAALVQDAALRATSIRIGLTASRRPVAGNYIGIGQRLHVITSVVAVNATQFDCGVEPGLRADTPSGTPVNFTTPVCLMRLAAPVDSLLIDANLVTTVSLDFVEAL